MFVRLIVVLSLSLLSACGRGEVSIEQPADPIVITTDDGTANQNTGPPANSNPNVEPTPDPDPDLTPDPNPDPEPDPDPDPVPACTGVASERCGDVCVDITSDRGHCGMCDRACAGGEACVDSACIALTEVEGILAGANAARASGADCGSRGAFGPAPALAGDANLHIAAQAHADDMAANNFFSHTGSDGSNFGLRISRTEFSGQPIGENIAAGNRTAEATTQQWLDSDGHCANIMNPNATKLGVGFALGGQYGTLWVQVFAR